ncbi:hypothetical protein GGTG_12946 [Gaeumannomyces tritici R3-111a-1]|uniref:Uncharacterized protein n=1 Tax=Gaeumannomyces tritici (strain R3-111a-1) TaxID=644352 RepID=J3PHG6_GAET3|nr:hypothetical protein GGTG_12946 [Gaeumannomyces tritici R3-111a-1]EJT69327.1 hypothetical protein GGTG_12946 [Gaeumannomyces tritici R3-111a-1]
MSAAERLKFLLVLLFAGCVAAADAGDDFSNNLFSDLAPLLALFGERVTMQFISQSTGWADNIILAMAPLGVITAIVCAIRVGGPSWLKAIIGRARESRAVIESELMSSTSHEVCELWNGQQIVRVMGKGPILEFIILSGKGSGENEGQAQTATRKTGSTSETESCPAGDQDTAPKIMKLRSAEDCLPEFQPTIRDLVFGNRLLQRQDTHRPNLASQLKSAIYDMFGKSALPGQDPETAPLGPSAPTPQKVHAVIRNTEAHTPNLTLNVHNQVGRGELYIVAACGTVLQLGVLVYSGLAARLLMFTKDGNPVAEYAFPCTAVGALLLVVGILVCSHVVESATSETRYRPKDGMEARVVWLQRSGTVNDQSFEPFAIFPRKPQPIITTSHRASQRKQGRRTMASIFSALSVGIFGMVGATVEELVTVVAVFVSVSGFILQFTGLRAMHWSASVTQLGATALMTILRAWVRRNLAENPKALPLVPGHELDWLAMTLGGKNSDAPWLRPPKVDGQWDKRSRPWADNGHCDWRIAAVEDPAGIVPTQSKGSGSWSNAHRVMEIRRDLGELADWHGPASTEAISLARAIEETMDALFGPDSASGEFTWSLKALWSLERPDYESIPFHVKRHGGRWRAYSDEIEAALSLWLYSVDKQENNVEVAKEKKQKESLDVRETQGKDGGERPKDDAWLRKETSAKPSLRLLGSHTAALYRDLQWWLPDGAARVIEVDDIKPENDSSTMEVEAHRIVGFASGVRLPPADVDIYLYERKSPEAPCEDAPLAVESYSPLKTLYAQHMFSAFMWAAAEAMKRIEDRADVRPAQRDGERGEPAWQSIALRNTRLSKMAQDIHATGLGSLEEIYLAIIPPLSVRQKLPQADAIVELARQHAKQHEELQHWKQAGDAYLWLFRMAKTFPEQSRITTKATAVLMEYLRTVTRAFELREAQQYEEGDIRELEELRSDLEKELRTAGRGALSGLMRLYEHQGRHWTCVPVQEARCGWVDDTTYPETFNFTELHQNAGSGYWWDLREVLERGNDANPKDIHDWTPLHYAAATGSDTGTTEILLKCRADVNPIDLLGWTPLHYACQTGRTAAVQILLIRGAEHVRGKDGMAPLHCAAMGGHLDVVRQLTESGAALNVLDASGTTPLHWAAYDGHKDVVEYLRQDANKKLRDHYGRTVLHLAAVAGMAEVVRLLKGAEKEAKDRNGRTPLHLAAQKGHEAVARLLAAELGAEKEAKDLGGQTPLHLAAQKGHEAAARLLVEAGADKEAKDPLNVLDASGTTPLHWAAYDGHKDVVEYLRQDANKKLRDHYGRTVLHLAAVAGMAEVVRLLKGAEKEAKDRNGRTPLHLAAQKGHEAVARLLAAELGAEKEAKDLGGQTPLHLAAQKGHEAAARLLVEAGADKEAKDRYKRTPLHWAALGGHEAVARLLVEAGADKEAKNDSGRTPLHWAALGGHKAVAKLLVEAGADKEAKNDSGWTPLHWAALKGHEAVARLLVEAGVDKEAKDKDGRTPLDLVPPRWHDAVARLLLA